MQHRSNMAGCIHPAAVFALLDRTSPFHLAVDGTGTIIHAGPTLAKIGLAKSPVGRDLLSVVDILRPISGLDFADLHRVAGKKLHMRFRDDPGTRLKGEFCPLRGSDISVLDLSFGIGIVDAVRQYGLNARDFSHTDLAVEMLYLVEAKTAVIGEVKKLNDRLRTAVVDAETRAFTDTLTGIGNRRMFDTEIEKRLAADERVSLMLIDLDHFKTVNDTRGHAAGDQVLRHVAQILTGVTRSGDMLARVGGDEFIILFAGSLDIEQLDLIASRVISGIETPIPYARAFARVSASIGITQSVNYDRPTSDQMLRDADRALYLSKDAGKGIYTIFNPKDGMGIS
ncbi:GGDEF domain-containing protein [Aestuariibius insulae]|uniref:GGDEF domain-containing protein n=1 Tax=Aestuariibius insulae TaxID=2058287 RepID=UPI00347FA4DE